MATLSQVYNQMVAELRLPQPSRLTVVPLKESRSACLVRSVSLSNAFEGTGKPHFKRSVSVRGLPRPKGDTTPEEPLKSESLSWESNDSWSPQICTLRACAIDSPKKLTNLFIKRSFKSLYLRDKNVSCSIIMAVLFDSRYLLLTIFENLSIWKSSP